ncbi:MAG: hypothetical protein V1926_02065 [Candidatus Peregrinibacteria bacterium]
MNSLLFALSLAALFSTTSLLVVLWRVSPLLSPWQALPAFFVSLFLSVSSVGALLFLALWKMLPIHTWDTGKMLSSALRQGIFLALAVTILVVFLLLELLNWWIAMLIISVFVLIELALEH